MRCCVAHVRQTIGPRSTLTSYTMPSCNAEGINRIQKEGYPMLKKLLLGTALGFALLPIVSVPAGANIASMTQAAIGANDTMVVQVAKRKGGGAHHANKGGNKGAKKNVNVNKKVNR